MSTDLKDAVVTLTPQEAEAIIQLWAKRQSETEALRSRLTVQDMAEAMSIEPGEVEKMLAAVRQGSPVNPAKQARPVNKPLIAIAVVVWISILIGACVAAFEAGGQSVRRIGPTPEISTPLAMDTTIPEMATASLAPPAEDPATAATTKDIDDLAEGFSTYLSIQFDKARIEGKGIGRIPLRSEALQEVVHTIAPTPSAHSDSDLSDAQIVQALQSGKAGQAKGVIDFKEMTLRANGAVVSATIPISLTQNPRILQLVLEEQARKLRLLTHLANQNLQL